MSDSAKHQLRIVPDFSGADSTEPDDCRPTAARPDLSGPRFSIVAIDHVQVAMPPGGEELARQFYVEALHLDEMEKPNALGARGGCWFERGGARIHVGVETDFHPARKAHPALVVVGLDALVDDLERVWSLTVRWSDEIPGVRRCHVDDPFGNRIELIDGGTP